MPLRLRWCPGVLHLAALVLVPLLHRLLHRLCARGERAPVGGVDVGHVLKWRRPWISTGLHDDRSAGVSRYRRIEDDIIRKLYRDPRIYAALNCASLGCPRLPCEPFEASALDRQLDAAMRELIAEEERRGHHERGRGNESPSVIDP